MNETESWELLGRGGVARSSVVLDAEKREAAEIRLPKYNGLSDPSGAERLGSELADRARALNATLVVVWEDPEDVVLGHVVGRELGLPVVRSYNADGLVAYTGAFPGNARALLLADAFRDPTPVRAMRSLVEQHGGTVVGTMVLLDTDALAASGDNAGKIVSLVSARTEAGRVAHPNGTR